MFGYWVRDPERYGVVEFDADGSVRSASRRSRQQPKSNYAVTGLYFYDGNAPDDAAALEPSPRGELEITDLNRALPRARRADGRAPRARLRLARHRARTSRCCRPRTSSRRSSTRQGLKVACPEEIAYQNGWIDRDRLLALAEPLRKNGYGQYLLALADGAFARHRLAALATWRMVIQ